MNTPTDKAFDERDPERDAAISQRYRELPADDVPAHLDQLILAQARDAITAAPRVDELAAVREKRRRLLRWSVPTALAASTLLVVTIVMRSGVQHEASPVALSVPKQAAASAATPAAADNRLADKDVADKKREESVVMVAPPRAATGEDLAYYRSARQAPAASPPPRPAMQAPAPAAAPPQQLEAVQVSGAEPAEVEADVRESQQRMLAQQQMASRAAAASSEAQTAVRQTSAVSSIMTAADAVSVPNLARLHPDPEAWLKNIRYLRRDGQQEVADREWKQFLATYPDHPVAETDEVRGERQ